MLKKQFLGHPLSEQLFLSRPPHTSVRSGSELKANTAGVWAGCCSARCPACPSVTPPMSRRLIGGTLLAPTHYPSPLPLTDKSRCDHGRYMPLSLQDIPFFSLLCNQGGHGHVSSCLVVFDSATPWTVARQAPLSMGFSRQEYWSGLPCPSPGSLLNPGILCLLLRQADSLPQAHIVLANETHTEFYWEGPWEIFCIRDKRDRHNGLLCWTVGMMHGAEAAIL